MRRRCMAPWCGRCGSGLQSRVRGSALWGRAVAVALLPRKRCLPLLRSSSRNAASPCPACQPYARSLCEAPT